MILILLYKCTLSFGSHFSMLKSVFRVRKYILPNSNVIIDGVNVVTLYYFKFCARAYTFLLHFFFVVSVVYVSLGLFVD